MIHLEQTTYTFIFLPRGYVNAPSSLDWYNIVPIDLTWLDIDNIMLIGPAEQEVTSASSTHAFQRVGEKSYEVCHVSNIFRGSVDWYMLRNPPKVKDKLLALPLPTSKKETQHL